MVEQITDKLGRPIRDLRLSVTDRCNFRCDYCMPKEIFGDDFVFLPKDELLTFDEMVRIAQVYTQLGVKKIRITGGEPLLRRDLDKLIYQLNQLEGVEDIGLTTNGLLLKKHGQKLYDAGLRRINVSLDAIDDAVFQAINNRNIKASTILQQIDYAVAIGFQVKVNVVVQKGVNDDQIVPMVQYFKDKDVQIRFIEFMDVGNDNGWDFSKVVSKDEMLEMIEQNFDIEPVAPKYYGEVAKYYQHKDNKAQFGLITSVSQSFCSTCTRARLSSDGKFYGCLFSTVDGFNVKSFMRNGATDNELFEQFKALWNIRDDRYSDERTEQTVANRKRKKINMNYIGG
ncbi:cyclic pyranopterin phosphate synthase MoaA [Staphylococcus saprophyticus]|uniref:GTP 3',8-cyclase n=1 Tax=Staphylococcus saprophyticus subsp. saprophyticus (strain ATCC 15305 / DSM 20229 / NCIMB 8711 / NCTC 7292 / S-41) TaxID=342451 RepID=MOAA_STAS1|nr:MULTISPECIES: GTP 3',8-cyclase MoaA [Staphylococcus]Q49ZI6.1 RecName: Full=GTP 3',8-cyclase; AltName: Full=Molybdenum cofactor biosynthesis protein A [Staphylococcus saprophyticus subsp. saprophyticus ATCC 15305 = NCTC 7292]CRV28600.1 metallo cofactor biosynthesis protein [Streptococcus equi subsp. equi]SIN58600.1 molybdopterin cofactor biosynthesis protein A [Mycobacteroides abscessus subsp. abscessus]AMG19717.1 cyclic pyranopterin monophosphate synthase [Staphylococcus saprophyticus]AMG32